MTISGYEQPWQVERHLQDLQRERRWCEERGDTATIKGIDQQSSIFEAELQAMKKAEIEEAARQAAELEQKLKETA
jgi:hypothetical protein